MWGNLSSLEKLHAITNILKLAQRLWHRASLLFKIKLKPAAFSQSQPHRTRTLLSNVPSLFLKKRNQLQNVQTVYKSERSCLCQGLPAWTVLTEDPAGPASFVSGRGQGGGWLLIVLAHWNQLWTTASLCVKVWNVWNNTVFTML